MGCRLENETPGRGENSKDETPGSPSHRHAPETRLAALRCRGIRWWGVSRNEELVLWAVLLSIVVRSTRGQTTPEFLLDAPNIVVSTAAGSGQYGREDGPSGSAQFDQPYSVAASPDGTWLAIAGFFNGDVRHVNLNTSTVSTAAGGSADGMVDGAASVAQFRRPRGTAVSRDGKWIAISDGNNGRVRRLDMTTGAVTTLSGSGPGYNDGLAADSRFTIPHGLAFDPTGAFLLVADSGNNVVRKIVTATGATTTVAGEPQVTGLRDGVGTLARFNDPKGVSISPDGTWAAVADSGNNAIRKILLATGEVTTISGGKLFGDYIDDVGTSARFSAPSGIGFVPSGNLLIICDTNNNVIRRMDTRSMAVTTLAGNGTVGLINGPTSSFAAFNRPLGLSIGPKGHWVAIADTGNHVIRNISASFPVHHAPQTTPDPFAEYSGVINLTSYACPSPRSLHGSGVASLCLAVAASLLAEALLMGSR